MALGSTQPLPGEFPGGKCGRSVRMTTLPPPCAVVMKSGNLNFLEPSGPLQACNGTDFTLPLLTMGTWMAETRGQEKLNILNRIVHLVGLIYEIIQGWTVSRT